MTKDQQAELEQVAREFLVRMEKDFTLLLHVEEEGWRVVNRADLHNHVVTLLAAQRAKVLEEVIADAKRRAYAIGLNEPLRTNYLYGFACDLESQLKEQRP